MPHIRRHCTAVADVAFAIALALARCGVPLDTLVDAVVGLLGYLVWNSRQPDPPGIPTLRAFQRRLADGVTTWLRLSGSEAAASRSGSTSA